MSVSSTDLNWSSKGVAVKWTPASMHAARLALASTSPSELLRLLLSLVHVRKPLYAQMSDDIKAVLEYCLAPASSNVTKWIRVVAAILKQAANAGTGLALERSASSAASADTHLAAALSPADELVDLLVRQLSSTASIDALAAAPPRRFLPHESCYLAPDLRPGGTAAAAQPAAAALLPPLNTSLSDFRTAAKALPGATTSANSHAAALALQQQFARLNPHCAVRIPISFDVVIPKDEAEEMHAHAQPMHLSHVHQPSASPPPVSAAKASAGAAAAFFPSAASSASSGAAARPSPAPQSMPLSRGTSSLFSTRPSTTGQPAPTISASAALAAIGGGGGGGSTQGPRPIPIPMPGTAAAAAGGFAKRSAIKMLDAAEANLSINAAAGGASGHAAKKARPSGPAIVPMISLPGTTTLQATSAPLSAKAEREREREAARAAKQRDKEEKDAAKEAAKAAKAAEKEAKAAEKAAKEQERADKKLQAILDKQSKEEAKAAKAAAKAAAAATGGATAAQPPAAQTAAPASFPAPTPASVPDYSAAAPALAVSSLPPAQQQQLALALGGAVPPQLLQALMTPQTPADQQMLVMMAAWGQMQQQQQQQQAQAQALPANVMYAAGSSLALPAMQPALSFSGAGGSYSLPMQATTLATAVSTSSAAASAAAAMAEFPPPPPMAAAPVAVVAMDTTDHAAFPPPPPVVAAAVPASSAAQLSGLINVGLLHQALTVSAPVHAVAATFFPPPPPAVSAPAPVPTIDPAAVAAAAAAAASAAAPAPAPAAAAAAAAAPAPVDVSHILAKSNRVTPGERDLITAFLHHQPFEQPFGAINDTYSIVLHEEETSDGWRETTSFEITSFAQGSWRKIKRRKKAKQQHAPTTTTAPQTTAVTLPAAAAATAPPAFVPPSADSEMPD